MNYLIAFILGYIGFDLFKRIKSYFFDKEQQVLNEKDKVLKEKQIELAYNIKQIKEEINKPVDKLTPEQIEDFWNKK